MDRFSPKHFIFLMLATGIVSLKTYPVVVIQHSGRDSWVALIAASALIAAYFLFAISTLKEARDVTLTQVYQQSFGKILGGFLILLFGLTVFATLLEAACIEADSMHQNMLVETPNWLFILLFVLPALYVVRKDLVAVVIITIIGVFFIMLAGIHLGILTTQQKDIRMLFPVFEEGITPGFWLSMLKALGMYGFLSITLPYLTKIQYQRGLLTKYSVIGLIIIIQMEIVSITGIFMTFSVQEAQSYYYPKLVQTHLVSYFSMLEFGELYVMLQILGGWLLKYLIAFHALLQMMESFKMKPRAIYISCFVITALVLVGAYLLSYTSLRLFRALEYLPWISLVNFILIPTVAFILFRRKNKRTPPAPAQPA